MEHQKNQEYEEINLSDKNFQENLMNQNDINEIQEINSNQQSSFESESKKINDNLLNLLEKENEIDVFNNFQNSYSRQNVQLKQIKQTSNENLKDSSLQQNDDYNLNLIINNDYIKIKEKNINFEFIKKLQEDENTRQVEIIDEKALKDFFILEQRIYILKTYFIKNNEKIDLLQVERSDFEWLHTILTYEFPGIIIPPIPDKNPMTKLPANLIMQLEWDILKTRKIGLQIFLKKILNHPKLNKSIYVQHFIEETVFKLETIRESTTKQFNLYSSQNIQTQLGITQISDTVINTINQISSFFSNMLSLSNENQNQLIHQQKSEFEKCLESQIEYYTSFEAKIQSIQKSFSNIFEKLKEESKVMNNLSAIFQNFAFIEENNQMTKLQENQHDKEKVQIKELALDISKTSEKISSIQLSSSQLFIEQIQIPLQDLAKYIQAGIQKLHECKHLQEILFQNKKKLQDLKAKKSNQAEKYEQVLEQAQQKYNQFLQNLQEDLIYFKAKNITEFEILIIKYDSIYQKFSQQQNEEWQNCIFTGLLV